MYLITSGSVFAPDCYQQVDGVFTRQTEAVAWLAQLHAGGSNHAAVVEIPQNTWPVLFLQREQGYQLVIDPLALLHEETFVEFDERHSPLVTLFVVRGDLKNEKSPGQCCLSDEIEHHQLRANIYLMRDVIVTLHHLGDSIVTPQLLAEITRISQGDDLLSRSAALAFLYKRNQTPELFTLLVALARSEGNPNVSWDAMHAICTDIESNPQFWPELIEVFDSWLDDIREELARVLASFEFEQLFPVLQTGFQSNNSAIRSGILDVFREQAEEVHPQAALIEQLLIDGGAFSDPDRDVRRLAANVVTYCQLDSDTVINGVVALLDDDDSWVQEQAAEAVLACQSAAAQAHVKAREILKDTES